MCSSSRDKSGEDKAYGPKGSGSKQGVKERFKKSLTTKNELGNILGSAEAKASGLFKN